MSRAQSNFFTKFFPECPNFFGEKKLKKWAAWTFLRILRDFGFGEDFYNLLGRDYLLQFGKQQRKVFLRSIEHVTQKDDVLTPRHIGPQLPLVPRLGNNGLTRPVS